MTRRFTIIAKCPNGPGVPVPQMLRSKAFTKITKKGAVVKVVKEHYLRDDIPCGLEGCTIGCNDGIKTSPAQTDRPGPLVLLLNPFDEDCRLQLEDAKFQHYILIPDTNVFLHHLDVLESKAFANVVVLQTVLEEVRNRSAVTHQRIRSLIGRPEKRFFVFSNEHHRDCFAGEPSAESANDRNDRAIRLATAWYAKHLQQVYPQHQVTPLLITNDAGNRERASQEQLVALPLSAFIELVPLEAGRPALLDMLEGPGGEADDFVPTGAGNFKEYPEHLSEAALKAGIESGRFFSGKVQASPFNPFKGTLNLSAEAAALQPELATISLPDRMAMNRAIHGDLVVVEVLPRDQWAPVVAAEEAIAAEEETAESEDEAQVPLGQEVGVNEAPVTRPVGRVVGILKRSMKPFVGSIDRAAVKPNTPLQTLLFHPLDKRIPRIRIKTRQAEQLIGKRILVSFDDWARKDRNPAGHFVRELGMAGDRATEIAAILLEHDVSSAPFTPAQLAELPAEGEAWTVRDEMCQGRDDYRHLDVCSIDPPGCTDIDDALHARVLPNGLIEVGVHIADVTHFVAPNGALDREAAAHATTVYLVDRRIDMLPALLGSNLCSLQGGKERLTFSVVWQMNPETAEIRTVHFARSVIKSRAALTYDAAQERLDCPQNFSADDPVVRSIHLLASLARKLKAKRIAAGALTLASPEVRFSLDTTTSNPVDVQVKEMKEANSLVEEFMLLANISVAERLLKAFPDTALLRRHPKPPVEAFAGLNRALQPYGLALDPHDSKSLSDSLDAAIIPGDDFFNKLVRIMTTRCMYQAQYFAAGTLDYPQFWHYGLACPLYTHFTSPIRRYADVLVHRLLAVAIDAPGAASVGYAADKTVLSDVCDNLNYRNRMAQQAQRASIDFFSALFFRGKTVTEDAYVIRMMKNALIVLVPKYGMECVVEVPKGCKLDAQLNAFVDEMDGAVRFRLFQHIQIELCTERNETTLQERLSVKLPDPNKKPRTD